MTSICDYILNFFDHKNSKAYEDQRSMGDALHLAIDRSMPKSVDMIVEADKKDCYTIHLDYKNANKDSNTSIDINVKTIDNHIEIDLFGRWDKYKNTLKIRSDTNTSNYETIKSDIITHINRYYQKKD